MHRVINGVDLHWNDTDRVTRLCGVDIPDWFPFYSHISFILHAEHVFDTEVETVGDLVDVIKQMWPNICRSEYSESLRDQCQYLFRNSLTHTDPDSLEERQDRNKPLFYYVWQQRGSQPVNYSRFVLLTSLPEEEREDDVEYTRGRVRTVHNVGVDTSEGFIMLGVTPFDTDVNRSEPSNNRDYFNVRNYSWRPSRFEFFSKDKERTELYFGLEIEVSTRLSSHELQTIVTKMEPKQDIFFYFKSDSSISGEYEYNYEIVTMPCTPAYHKEQWRILFKKLDELLAGRELSEFFDTGDRLTNGIHIHVSKNAFIQSTRQDQKHMNRFLTAFNIWDKKYTDWLTRVCRRPTDIKGHRFCSTNPQYEGYELSWRLTGKNKSRSVSERHSTAHETSHTVEVRCFQGIFDLNHIIACIEFTEAMFYYVFEAPLSAYTRDFGDKFTQWVVQTGKYRKAKEVMLQCA